MGRWFRGIWSGLKFVGRWIGPVVLLLALWLYLSRPIAFSEVYASPLLAGAIITMISSIFMRSPNRRTHRRILFGVALAATALWGWQYWQSKSGYRTEIVNFDSKGTNLVGTLFLPDGPGKHPGIVFVHGSGAAPRWTNEVYGTYFARKGFAMLIFDKRGVGDSGGHYEWERNFCPDNLDLLASDASAALSLLAKRPEVRADATGFMGVSQGGWIVPRAASKNPQAAFMLLMVGPTTSTHAVVRHEWYRLGQVNGNDKQGAEGAFILLGSGGRNIPDGMTPDEVYDLAQETRPDFVCPSLDPMADLRALDIPGLWVLGGEDWIVPFEHTSHNLDLLREAGKPYEYRKIPGAGHLLIGQSSLIEQTVDSWLSKVAARRE